MIKSLTFLKRKAGITPEQFRKHYEEVHAPLASNYMPTATRYFRRYITAEANPTVGNVTSLDIDVITELWFETREDFEKTMAIFASPEVRAIIAADEENLFDRDHIKLVTVTECETELVSA